MTKLSLRAQFIDWIARLLRVSLWENDAETHLGVMSKRHREELKKPYYGSFHFFSHDGKPIMVNRRPDGTEWLYLPPEELRPWA